MSLKVGDVIGWNWSGTHGPILATVKEDLGGGCYGLTFGDETLPTTPILVINPETGQPILDWKIIAYALKWRSDGEWLQRSPGISWGSRGTAQRFTSRDEARKYRDELWEKGAVSVVRLLRKVTS